ncbi:hypothetical protein C8Q76DRAFT_809898 [Earliella scabrosa]|nr:hypothetical protein C8Q76DRAFT_809898 [Earliella scabrosa]
MSGNWWEDSKWETPRERTSETRSGLPALTGRVPASKRSPLTFTGFSAITTKRRAATLICSSRAPTSPSGNVTQTQEEIPSSSRYTQQRPPARTLPEFPHASRQPGQAVIPSSAASPEPERELIPALSLTEGLDADAKRGFCSGLGSSARSETCAPGVRQRTTTVAVESQTSDSRGGLWPRRGWQLWVSIASLLHVDKGQGAGAGAAGCSGILFRSAPGRTESWLWTSGVGERQRAMCEREWILNCTRAHPSANKIGGSCSSFRPGFLPWPPCMGPVLGYPYVGHGA